ncbi:translation elongation factor Ts [Raineya orbicola]|jgi:elongation factor Ts|uniref:Elongation factor Ts n=1 Tax=Raineya orbicola TaxID=2016530 RepID=A0A2N3IHZ2_9BACT|nr:translation elongation factor Ts [Raineya orbicola]PKQ69980.1 tsf: translation elongation factor Ts [Raineya orbicola]
MAITAQDVNKLRQMTGMGMMDCKQALTEANGDFEKAIEFLRKKGEKISAKRADNETKEGVVMIYTNEAQNEGIMFAFNCETESVAKNAEFNALAERIMKAAIAQKPDTIEQLMQLASDGRTLQEYVTDFIGKVGEKILVTAYAKVAGEKVTSYLHSNNKLGVLVVLEGTNGVDYKEIGKDLAMQIAAMNPIAVDRADVPQHILDKELEIGMEQARNEGKPENMLEKIAQGKVNKFIKESTLLNQEFVKDSSKTVAQYLQGISKDLKVVAFKRISVA